VLHKTYSNPRHYPTESSVVLTNMIIILSQSLRAIQYIENL